ncbi:MAG TPA: rhomboid family intramembrane serine protease, partial [Nannocystis exedens]|nr:rhomboid family intramembrane serine protease [Nannocystis exedens]
MTTALISLCVVTFALTLVLVGTLAEDPLSALIHSLWSIDSDAGLVQLGALELSRVWLDGDWWRLLTAAFLHGSWLHLLLNLSALWSIGEWLEPAIGSRKTLAIFLIAALGGSLASLVWCEAPVVVGASGGILGLAGALLYTRLFFSSASAIENLPSPTTAATDSVPSIVLPARSTPAASSASSDSSIPAARAASADTASLRDLREISAPSLAIMIALCLGLGLVVPMIAQAGHVGGLITGVLATITLLKRGRWR